MKRITGILLSASLMLGVFLTPGFASDNQGKDKLDNRAREIRETREKFDEFLNKEFIDYVTGDSFSLHMTLKNPKNYGIDDHEISWGSLLNSSITNEQVREARKSIAEFKKFDRALLTFEQRESYDIYAYGADLFEEGVNFYYFSDPLQGGSRLHIDLPIVLSEYYLSSQQDIENYLTLCSQFGLVFDAIIKFQQDKSKKWLFMSDKLADDVIKNCNDFLSKTEDNILITSFEKRISEADFLSKSQKSEYIAKNKKIFNSNVIPAYKKLISELTMLKGTGRNDMGLAHFNKGKDFYRYELKRMGISRTPEELIDIYNNKLKKTIDEILQLARKNPEIFDVDNYISPKMSAEKAMAFLKDKSLKDFPALPKSVTYTIKEVDESLDTAPGFYLKPRLDDYNNNIIYYNNNYTDNRDFMYKLMAHEGYPGHLLQYSYLYSTDLPNYRKVAYYKAYSEGWATYTESYAFKYLDAKEDMIKFKQLENELNGILSCALDLGINYSGWTQRDMTLYLKKNHFHSSVDFDDEIFTDLYYHVIKHPMNPIPYHTGQYEIELLKGRYKTLLGAAYSDKLFHEEFLKRGPSPFVIVRKWMDNVMSDILNNKKKAA